MLKQYTLFCLKLFHVLHKVIQWLCNELHKVSSSTLTCIKKSDVKIPLKDRDYIVGTVSFPSTFFSPPPSFFPPSLTPSLPIYLFVFVFCSFSPSLSYSLLPFPLLLVQSFPSNWIYCLTDHQAKDGSLLYGVCQTLVNLTNTFDKPDIPDEMKQLGEFAKVKLPEFSEKVRLFAELLKEHCTAFYVQIRNGRYQWITICSAHF